MVLADLTESFAARLECMDSTTNQWEFRVVRFDEAQQDVYAGQVQQARH
jgi:hypothetical protein